MTSAAFAGGSLKDEPAPAREFTYSFSVTGTSDYVFRGQTQSYGEPALQGAINMGYGIFYAGAWASSVDFGGGGCILGDPDLGCTGQDAQVEIDYYAGIKPTWGPATFDFGVIYYAYPGARDDDAELDYVEFKAAVSGEILKSLTGTAAVYYSPEYTNETGEAWTFEGGLAYALPQVWIFSPTVGGAVGHSDVELGEEWYYWNAGVSLAVEKITFDFRYWGSDLSTDPVNGYPEGAVFGAGDRFVFSTTVALP
jgi:uncharacterized protein (TIGR02001 family)